MFNYNFETKALSFQGSVKDELAMQNVIPLKTELKGIFLFDYK